MSADLVIITRALHLRLLSIQSLCPPDLIIVTDDLHLAQLFYRDLVFITIQADLGTSTAESNLVAIALYAHRLGHCIA